MTRIAGAEQMRRLDALAAQRGLPTAALMENAGAAVAREVLGYLGGPLGLSPAGASVVVCCGRGSNGGDGFVAARRLALAGARVSAFLCPAREGSAAGLSAPVQANLEAAARAGVSVVLSEPGALREALAGAAVVVDAVLGTGSRGAPTGPARAMIEAVAACGRPVVAVDLPSGLDADTGAAPGPVVTAALTLTLGAAKRGLLVPEARPRVGELRVLDIGYPPGLLEEVLGP